MEKLTAAESNLSSQKMSKDSAAPTAAPISSLGLQSGTMPLISLDGATDWFGPAPALAPVSAPQEKAKGLETLVTSGLIGSDSSASAGLQACLESRLMQRLDTAGSTL